MNNLLILSPLVLIFFASIMIIYKNEKLFSFVAIFISMLIAFYYISSSEDVSYVFGSFTKQYGIEFRFNGDNKLLLLLTSLPVLLVIVSSFSETLFRGFYPIAFFTIGGFIGMTLSADLFNIYVFMEITSLCSYALVALSGKKHSYYYALIYLITGTIGATLYLLGIGFLYIKTGGLNIEHVALQLKGHTIEKIGIILIFIGLLIKIGITPFHFWVGGVYKNSNQYVNSLFSLISANVLLLTMMKIFSAFPISEEIKYIISIIASFSTIYTAFFASLKDDLNEALAYSSISNYSLAILASVCGSNEIATIIIVSHALSKSGLFLSIGSNNKIPSILFLLNIFGLPPLIGFYGKWKLLLSLGLDNVIASAAILLSSVFALFYCFNIGNQLQVSEKDANKIKEISVYILSLSIIVISLIVLSGVVNVSK